MVRIIIVCHPDNIWYTESLMILSMGELWSTFVARDLLQGCVVYSPTVLVPAWFPLAICPKHQG